MKPLEDPGRIILESSTLVQQMSVNQPNSDVIEMKNVYFPELEGSLRPLYASKSGNIFPFWVEITKID